MKKILVIVVTYNAMKWAKKCFDSLRKSSYPVDVFVVDNGSSDGSQEYIRRCYPEFLFRQNSKNIGFGKANNIGLQYAVDNDYDYVYLLNQDAWIMENTIAELIAVMDKNPEYGVVSPMQLDASGNYFSKSFVLTSFATCVPISVMQSDMYFRRNLCEKVYEVSFVMAAHWMISKKCLCNVGGFSPTFFQYGEDNNYLHRVRYLNFKVGLAFDCCAIHDNDHKDKNIMRKFNKPYHIYTTVLTLLSDPNSNMNIVGSALGIFVRFLKTRNIEFLKYFLKLVRDGRIIIKDKELSKKGFSFLEKRN